jgi:hypothetical protein
VVRWLMTQARKQNAPLIAVLDRNALPLNWTVLTASPVFQLLHRVHGS